MTMFDSKLITGKLNRWEKFMKKFSLPAYDEIPNLGLYMDQVLTLMGQYLAPLTTADSEDTAITAATINNYVRVKVMPAPEKKKYLRIHIAYLIIICTLKQAMSISDIQALLPADMTDEEMRELYYDYSRYYKASVLFFINEVKDETDRILSTGARILASEEAEKAGRTERGEEIEESEGPSEGQIEFDYAVKSLIFSSATIANFSKLLTAKLIGLGGKEFSEEAVAERTV
jgi:hypothetical protein